MEIEDLQKIWNEQKGENMYAINETALHQSIRRKKASASRKINLTEIGITIINTLTAVILFIDALDDPHRWDFLFSGILAATVIYILYARHHRIRAEKNFDRTMIGELEHAIANTQATLRFNYLMMAGYMLPLLTMIILKMIDQGASPQRWLLILGMFAVSLILIQWERKKSLLPRKRKLQALKSKLME